jgi:hypothetical protein
MDNIDIAGNISVIGFFILTCVRIAPIIRDTIPKEPNKTV